ncbi:hypothetical protein Tco_0093581 [Tanacetum coccineum]
MGGSLKDAIYIKNAVVKMFPDSHHRLLMWHITEKLSRKVYGYIKGCNACDEADSTQDTEDEVDDDDEGDNEDEVDDEDEVDNKEKLELKKKKSKNNRKAKTNKPDCPRTFSEYFISRNF